jgi:hypothetical protein
MQHWETQQGNYLPSNAQFFMTDANGDGLPDLVYVFSANELISTDVHVNNGSQFTMQHWESQQGSYLPSNAYWLNFDADGDGVSDMVYAFSDAGAISVDVHQFPSQNSLVTSFSLDGLVATNVQYKSAASMYGSGYKKDVSSAYPNVVMTPNTLLVSSYAASNGVGGMNNMALSYGNFKVQSGAAGRGPLGFQWMQSQDATTGLANRTCYRQDWPYVGLVDKVMSATSTVGLPTCGSFASYNDLSPLLVNGSGLLSLTLNAYKFNAYALGDSQYASPMVCTDDKTQTVCNAAAATAAGNRYQVYAFQSLTQSRDWNGTNFVALPATRTTMVQDNLGNATMVKAETLNADGSTPSGYSKTTANTYMAPDWSNWLLGRLQKSSVQANCTGVTTAGITTCAN